MYKHFLIATDGSELSQKAVNEGLALARALGANVAIAHVTPPWTSVAIGEVAVALPPEDYDRMAASGAQAILANAAMAAKAAGVSCETLHVKDRLPAAGILEAAAAQGADLIVMSSHGRTGLARLLLGSQANEVLHKSAVPVLICR
jgi:nucleotide-binding universal stress UspA family protein